MSKSGAFIVGLAALLLSVLIAYRLPCEYRHDLRHSLITVGLVRALCSVHFALVVLATRRASAVSVAMSESIHP